MLKYFYPLRKKDIIMIKRIIMWLFFTIFIGILPLGFKWIIFKMIKFPFEISKICSEVYFFNLVLSAQGIKELYDLKNSHQKMLLLLSSVFILIFLSVIYGILLLNDFKNMDLDLKFIYNATLIISVCCVLINLSIQILEGIKDNEA